MSKTVSLYMINDPVVVSQNETLQKVINVFKTTGLSHLLVSNENEKLVGVISKEDILKRVYYLVNETSGKTYSSFVKNSLKAFEFMTSDPINLKPDDSVEYAVELLLQKEFHCLPVIKDDKAIGIVTSYDLLKAYYQEHG